jgi:hypothetical protein
VHGLYFYRQGRGGGGALGGLVGKEWLGQGGQGVARQTAILMALVQKEGVCDEAM